MNRFRIGNTWERGGAMNQTQVSPLIGGRAKDKLTNITREKTEKTKQKSGRVWQNEGVWCIFRGALRWSE